MTDFVFVRRQGAIEQEVGGAINSLASLCIAYNIDMERTAHVELDRCWRYLEEIKEKQKNKPPIAKD